tara:strand:- start:287 stop:808 length:522 start_codon:yes stop_codon:yes gene_type:complete
MKKLVLVLLLIPILSFGQDPVVVAVKTQTNSFSSTDVENELVLSNEKTTIKTPLTADLSNYTHLLLVDATLGSDNWYFNHISQFNKLEQLLSLSVFEVMNPYKVNKKRWKKEPYFLKTIKIESYLYMYVNQSQGRGDDVNTTFIIRDWKNKQIYNATHINTGLNEILAPLIDY